MSKSPVTTFLSGDADLLINVVDASNLERNLYLTLQLLELGIPLHRGTEHARHCREAKYSY